MKNEKDASHHIAHIAVKSFMNSALLRLPAVKVFHFSLRTQVEIYHLIKLTIYSALFLLQFPTKTTTTSAGISLHIEHTYQPNNNNMLNVRILYAWLADWSWSWNWLGWVGWRTSQIKWKKKVYEIRHTDISTERHWKWYCQRCENSEQMRIFCFSFPNSK